MEFRDPFFLGKKRVATAGADSVESFDSNGPLLTRIVTNRHALH